MNRLFGSAVLALIWVVLQATLTIADLLIGFGLGYVILVALRPLYEGRGSE